MKKFQINCPFFFIIIFIVRIKKNYQECSQNVFHIISYFFQNFCEKSKFFKSTPFFLILFLKQECKKNIRNVQKMLYTYYHGCYEPLCSVILLLPIFVDNIIISINQNCVVIFVIVSFIIDLLNLHFHITRQRKMSWIIHYQPHNDFG